MSCGSPQLLCPSRTFIEPCLSCKAKDAAPHDEYMDNRFLIPRADPLPSALLFGILAQLNLTRQYIHQRLQETLETTPISQPSNDWLPQQLGARATLEE